VCVVDLLGLSERHLLCRPDYADAVCVFDEGVRAALIGAGRPGHHVVVTGNPAFDTVLDAAHVAQGRRWRHEAGWDALHVCLYASSPEPASAPSTDAQGDPEFPRRIERTLLRAAEANPALGLWVRRHPSEARADDIAALCHPRVRVCGPEMDLHSCLHACDEVIVTVSTVGVEARIAGRWVTRVHGSIFDRFSPFTHLRLADRDLAVEDLAPEYATLGHRGCAGSGAAGERGRPELATDRVLAVLRSVQEDSRGA
jgi:hypothetical protein